MIKDGTVEGIAGWHFTKCIIILIPARIKCYVMEIKLNFPHRKEELPLYIL